jgi:RNA-directed DNA polymerase
VRVLQRKLYRAAKAAPRRTFGVLYDKVYRRDVLGEAWQRVRRNRGSAGIDKQTIAEVEAQGVDRILDELEDELREKRYRPMPVRRVYIPKPGKPNQRRGLGIPTVASYCTSFRRMLGCVAMLNSARVAHPRSQLLFG